ncbi:MAG TPA: TonB-dependent receptor [Bryobacteraceae bacterium]|nr:TonB-dependent receptor [Bryobacteraceae bacterium]
MRRIHTLVIAILFATGPNALAQSEAGSAVLSGTVYDTTRAVVSGSRVTITNSATGLRRELQTTAAGFYTAVRLPAGVYTVTAEKPGFRAAAFNDIRLTVGASATLDIVLETGATAESVTVTGEAPLVESTRSSVSTTVDTRAIRDLPINGRNFLEFTTLAPGVVRDPRIGDLSFAGQRGPANSLLIDGMDANSAYWGQSVGRAGFRNPYSFSQDSVAEFQVLTNSFAPEIGRATGGVVNVITKSGTNELHGAAFWFFRDRVLNANNFFNNRAGIARQPYHYNQFGGNVGGPVMRNRLFFFANYDGQRNTSPNAVYVPVAVPSDEASQRALAEIAPKLAPYTTGANNNITTLKADWIANSANNVSVRYNLHRFLGKNAESPGPQSAFDHTGDTVLDTDSVTVGHTAVLNPSLVLDSRFLFLREHNPSTASGDGPEVVIRQGGITAFSFGRGNFLPRYTEQNKYGFVQTLTAVTGEHTLKFGYDLKFERATNLATNLFYGQYTFNSFADFANRRPASYAQALPGTGTSGGLTYPDRNEFAFFAQDSWRATSRLTLNYGLRYDLFLYRGNDVRNSDPALAALRLQTGIMPEDYGNIAGRFGFGYRLDRAGRIAVRGGIGTFYGSLAGLVNRTVQAQNGLNVQTFTLLGAAIPPYPSVLASTPTSGAPAPDIYVMDPGFKSPRTHQWNLNLEFTPASGYAITLGYLGVRGNNLTRIRDVNQYPTEIVNAQLSDGAPLTFWRRPGTAAPQRPYATFGRISLIESAADSTYHAGFVQLAKRYAQRFQVLASYTWSKVIDTAPYGTAFIPNSAAEDPNLVMDTLNPNADRGVGDAHIPHRFVASAVWDVAWGIQFSTITQLQSGRVFSARSNVDLNNDGNRFTDRSPGYGRNTLSAPATYNVDVRISKGVRLWMESLELRLMGEAFNVFNRANFTAIAQTPLNYNATTRVFAPNATFLSPTASADARILQLAARISF